jgi:phosphate transport system protein
MSELAKRLDRLFLKLDHMALLVEQILADALYAVTTGNEEDAKMVVDSDETIDRREVEIERECIRLLALYQPAAIDLRRICFVIKANNDLERIADLCVNLAKMSMILVREHIDVRTFPAFEKLAAEVSDAYHQTIRLMVPPAQQSSPPRNDANDPPQDTLAPHDLELAWSIIKRDTEQIDVTFREYLDEVFSAEGMFQGKLNAMYALTTMGRALERLGDQCTNIAEDAIFLITGEIVRHESDS